MKKYVAMLLCLMMTLVFACAGQTAEISEQSEESSSLTHKTETDEFDVVESMQDDKPSSYSYPDYSETVPTEPFSDEAGSTQTEPLITYISYDPEIGPVVSKNAVDLDSEFSLYQLNPDTQELNLIFDCPQSLNNNTLYRSKTIVGAYARQHFNKDLSKYAVSWHDRQTGENHVGWIDRDGNLTDLSCLYHGDSTDFYASAVNDVGAIFSPEGKLLFKDKSADEWVWYDTEKNKTVQINASWIPDDWAFYKPDGVWTDWQDGWGFNVALFSDPIFGFKMGDNIYYVHYTGRVETLDFYGTDTIIGILDGGLVAFGPGISETVNEGKGYGYSSEKCMPITSESTYTITGCACYQEKIAFSATRGNETYLFIMYGINGSESIERIGKLPEGYRVVFW